MTRLTLATAMALVISVPALAQQSAPATSTPAPAAGATSTEGGASAGGMTMGTTSTVALKFVELSSADVMASRLEDADVYNNKNEMIGEIEDLVIKDGKTISGVVVSVGGFLGMGDRYVLLDPSSIVLNEKDGELRAFIDTSKEELTGAPEFEYKED